MPRRSRFYPAPTQGQSDAPDFAKLAEQATRVVNFIPQFPRGTERRPPLHYGQQVLPPLSGVNENMAILEARVGAEDWSLCLFRNDSGDMQATAHTRELPGFINAPVTITPAAQAYLNQAVIDRDDLDSKSVAGTTFIWNRQVTVQNLENQSSPARPFEGIIWVRAGFAARTYVVRIRNADTGALLAGVNFLLPDGLEPDEDERFFDTKVIAEALLTGNLPANIDGGAAIATFGGTLQNLASQGFTVQQRNSIIYLAHPTINFTIQVDDGRDGDGLNAIKDEIDGFNNLPRQGFPGMVVRVSATATSDDDDYFAVFDETAGSGTGLWRETIAPDTPLGLDANTMPVGAIYNADINSWTIDTLNWGLRTVGDEFLSADPDFIGQEIRDMSFFRGRLALLYGESCALSSARDGFAFYPTTVVTVDESDPIFLTSTLDEETEFLWFAAYARRLIIVAADALFEVTSIEGPFRPDTATLQNLNNYDGSARSRPFAVNSRLYFVGDTSEDTGVVFELAVTEAGGDAENLNTAVPNILTGRVLDTAVYGADYLSLYAEVGTNRAVCHVFRFAERRRIQNAFVEWELAPSFKFVAISVENSTMYVHFLDELGALHVGTIELARQDLGFGTFSNIYQDGQLRNGDPALSIGYDQFSDRTTVVAPYSMNAEDAARFDIVALGPLEASPVGIAEGGLGNVISRNGNILTVQGDWRTQDFSIGVNGPNCFWSIPQPVLLDRNNSPDFSTGFQVAEVAVIIQQTGHVEAFIDGELIGDFSGLEINTFGSGYDEPVSFTGTFSIPIMQQAITIPSIEVGSRFHMPLTFNGAHVYGQQTGRAF